MYGLDPTILIEYQILRFITHLNSISLSISTIMVYIAGVRAWAIANNVPVPDLHTPRITWALKLKLYLGTALLHLLLHLWGMHY